MLVKNLKGTGDKETSCGCSSWLDHWNKNRYPNNDYEAGYCRACKSKKNLLGGHVIKKNSDDRYEYIVPICSACNNDRDKEFDVKKEDLILANTCKE